MPTNWGDERPVLVAPLKIDSFEMGEIWIHPKPYEVLMDKQQILTLLINILKEPIYSDFKNIAEGKNYFIDTQIEKFGIEVIFDSNELILYFKIPNFLRKASALSIQRNHVPKGQIIERSTFSSFLNFNYTKQIYEENEIENLYNEFNLNIHDHVLNAAGYLSENDETQVYKREYTRYIKDFKKQNSRLILGDLDHNTVDIQDQIEGAGLTLQNDFSINPRRLRTNFNQYEIDLKLPSTLEVYLNDSRIYKSSHPAGTLNLNQLPLIVGLNDIKIVITDINGKVQTRFFNTNYHSDLLPKGIHDYSFNIFNKSSESELGELEYNNQQTVLTGFYRYGITQATTAGFNHQQFNSNTLSGLELTSSLSRSVYSIKASQSTFEEVQTNSYYFSLQNIYNFKNLRKFPIRFSYRYYDRDFTSILGAVSSIQNQYLFNTSYQINSKLTLGLGAQLQQRYEIDEATALSSLEAIYRISPNMNFSIKGQRDHTNDEENNILFSFNWSEMKRRISGNHRYETRNHQLRNQVHFHKNIKGKRLYTSLNYDKNYDTEIEQARVFTQLDTNSGSVRLDYQNSDNIERKALNLRFALVATNETFNIAPFVNNSFLVFKSNTENPIYVADNETDAFSKDSHLIKTNLTPYTYNTYQLGLNSLEMGEEVSYDRLSFMPSYKSGAVANINVLKQTSLVFRLKEQDSPYMIGVIKNNQNTYEFMTGKTGRVFVPSINPGEYQLMLNKVFIKTIVINKESGYINLGDINVKN